MKYIKNNQAFTLIEVLASITILGIILTIFLSFLSNSMMFSVKTEDKLTAINYADTALNSVKDILKKKGVPTVDSCINTTETEFPPSNLSGFNQTAPPLNNKTYNLEVYGCSEEYGDNHNPLGLIRLHVKILSEDNKFITEQYDYYVIQ